MSYAEAAYFDGNRCAHVAAHEERALLARLTSADLVQFALEADREARRLAKAGRLAEAAEEDAESERLAALYRARA